MKKAALAELVDVLKKHFPNMSDINSDDYAEGMDTITLMLANILSFHFRDPRALAMAIDIVMLIISTTANAQLKGGKR